MEMGGSQAGTEEVGYSEWTKGKKAPKAKHRWIETGQVKLKELVGQA